MKFIISKYFALSALCVLTLSPYAYAETSELPKTTQVNKKDAKASDKIEIVPEIKIEAGSSSKNSKLKEGAACNFDDLEEAEGEEFSEIPMAETVPCDNVDCNNLNAATLHKDNYQKLPDSKTIKGCD